MVAAEKALWFIESHYGEPLSLAGIAEVAGVSAFHLARLFPAMTGYSVVRYLRARRLSEAARRLADGAPDNILEAAMSCGYGSHEAFTRAFGEQFGMSPSLVREQASLAGVALVEPWRTADCTAAGRRQVPLCQHLKVPQQRTHATAIAAAEALLFRELAICDDCEAGSAVIANPVTNDVEDNSARIVV